jgi:uncharacterized lipoprotein YmbA
MKRLLLLIPLLLSSCSLLMPVRDTSVRHRLEPTVPDRSSKASSPSVAIARASLPAYLDREELVTRDAGGELQKHDSHLWSESLDTGIARVIATTLRRLTGSRAILPIDDFIALDYSHLVELRIAQFDPDASGNLILRCSWKAQPVEGGEVKSQSFNTAIPIQPTKAPITGRITAMNEALEQLARVIAKSL